MQREIKDFMSSSSSEYESDSPEEEDEDTDLPYACFEGFITLIIESTDYYNDPWIGVKFQVAFENSDTDTDSWNTVENTIEYVGGELNRIDATKIVETWNIYLQSWVNYDNNNTNNNNN